MLAESVIGRPRKLVAEYVADPTNPPKWCENIESNSSGRLRKLDGPQRSLRY